MSTLSEIFKILGDDNRLNILNLLSESELCVYELMEKMNMSQSTVSHHLKLLKNIELIKSRKAGKWVFYSINEENVQKIHKETDEVFSSLSKTPYTRDDLCEDCAKNIKGEIL